MSPRIMIIRHAERPERDGTEVGVDQSGRPDKDGLLVRGWQRAGAIAHLFGQTIGDGDDHLLTKPLRLIAARPTEAKPSDRSRLTLLPLSELIGVPISTQFTHGQEEKLAGSLLKSAETVLIAWEHKAIADIVRHLIGSSDAAPKWPDSRFDMAYVLSGAPGRHLTQVPMHLLAGDSSDIFSFDKGSL